MKRTAKVARKTKETQISADLDLDGTGKNQVTTGIAFFDHMLTLFSVHGLFDLNLSAQGDIDVDYHPIQPQIYGATTLVTMTMATSSPISDSTKPRAFRYGPQ